MAKILIIDDETQLRGLLSRIIGLEGYEVIQAENCTTGLRQLERTHPEVVLCDVKLPDGNGVEMVTRIKQAEPDCEAISPTAYRRSRTAHSTTSPKGMTTTRSFRC